MKKVTGIVFAVGLAFILTGCNRPLANEESDGSKSYQCVFDSNENENQIHRELLVSVDAEGKVMTYNVVENESYVDEEEYTKACNQKEELEKNYNEKKYENIQYSKKCSKDGLAVNVNGFYDLTNLTDEEKSEIPEVTKYISNELTFDATAWMEARTKEKYKCN